MDSARNEGGDEGVKAKRTACRDFLKKIGILSTGIQTASLQESSKLLYYNIYRLLVILRRDYTREDEDKVVRRLCECLSLFEIGDRRCMTTLRAIMDRYESTDLDGNMYVKDHYYSMDQYTELLKTLKDMPDTDNMKLRTEMTFSGLIRNRHHGIPDPILSYCVSSLEIEKNYCCLLKTEIYNVPLCVRDAISTMYTSRISNILIMDIIRYGQSSLSKKQIKHISRVYSSNDPIVQASLKQVKALLNRMEQGQEEYEHYLYRLAKKRVRPPPAHELFQIYLKEKGHHPQINPILQSLIPGVAVHAHITTNSLEYREHNTTDSDYTDSRDEVLLILDKKGLIEYQSPSVNVSGDDFLYVVLKQ